MVHEVKAYKKPGSEIPEVVIMDAREILHAYSVEKFDARHKGYSSVFCNRDLDKCIAKAKEIFENI